MREIKNKLVAYEGSINNLISDHQEKEQKINEILLKVENQVQNAVMKFVNTHDSDIVKSYFTNTVLTPTEAAQIVAKVSASDKASSSNTQIAKSSSSANAKRSNTSVSPLRKTTPTRGS